MDPATTALAAFIADLIKQGILGIVIIGLLFGWLVPKWAVDEYRERLRIKNAIIERQALLIEKLAARGATRLVREARDADRDVSP